MDEGLKAVLISCGMTLSCVAMGAVALVIDRWDIAVFASIATATCVMLTIKAFKQRG